MAFQKYVPPCDAPSTNMKPLSFSNKANEKVLVADSESMLTEAVMDIDLRELYFLIMHFLSAGPCQRTCRQLWNELLEHQLLPRRYHAWYSRTGMHSGDENDDGISFPLNYAMLAERYSFIERDHLVKLLKQLLLSASLSTQRMIGGNPLNAAAVPTILGTGSFSLLSSDQNMTNNKEIRPPPHMRWPHLLADQVRGLSLREIGGGFSRHHRAPSTRAACYAIAKPSTMVQKMQNIKRVRGHRHAVYCAIFDRSGRFVITGSDDRLVKIWSMETAYCLASCRGHEGDITDLAVNFNNTLVASSSNDCIIRVWRLPDGLPISVLRGHTGAVTAIAFSPRPSAVYQLLSSSDDGTCRIWDARYSQFCPRIYVPKPSDPVPGRINGPSSSTAQQSHQIFCCAFNASGTVFVTGSSDTLARVWNACKSGTDDTEQPIHEMDVLAGHENDVNYVQFSGCAVASRIPTADTSKEENIPKFKNTWYNHDNIVTCSRDGSAIIWVPRSRRSHGKVGRWVRAYHLKVPPPPLPPQPPRGGPRQRILPTPRGVNMIIWSLDNRFVLAAIMDCRICVWNAADGSLVHSLTGHTESTYVLDVHPFNPRIAMSAGYDGKTIVWDIWEGIPIRTYEIGRFKLVDGKFSSDGTSIILSDDVGQLYILNTGEGELQKDAKYDQFFLGDYRPLIQDTHGNVLDQETQLAPYRRNMQDLLCDSGMIPYPEPYQSMYQQRRLGALGIEWQPPSVRFAVGADISLNQEYQMPPIADLDIVIEPLPEFLDAMDWEPEIEIQTDDTDSEYNVTEEYSSGGEQQSLCSRSSDKLESSGEDSADAHTHEDGLRRSRRKKKKAEAEITTSSGRRVKRKNLDGCGGSSLRSSHRKSRNIRTPSKKKSSFSKSLRPQRAAARNALHFFSQITGTSKDVEAEYDSGGDSSESESTMQDSVVYSEESDVSTQNGREEHSKGKEIYVERSVDVDRSHEHPETHVNAGTRRLVLKLSKPPQNTSLKFEAQPDPACSSATATRYVDETNKDYILDQGYTHGDVIAEQGGRSKMGQSGKTECHLDLLQGCKDGNISWGGVKARTSKRLKMAEASASGASAGSGLIADGLVKTENLVNEHPVSEKECATLPPSSGIQDPGSAMGNLIQLSDSVKFSSNLEGEENNEIKSSSNQSTDPQESPAKFHNGVGDRTKPSASTINGMDNHHQLEENSIPAKFDKVVGDRTEPSASIINGMGNHHQLEENSKPAPTKLRIKSKVLSRNYESPSKIEAKSSLEGSSHDLYDTLSKVPDKRRNLNLDVSNYKVTERSGLGLVGHEELDATGATTAVSAMEELEESETLHSRDRMFSAVYRRSKAHKERSRAHDNSGSMEASTSLANNHDQNEGADSISEAVRRTRSTRLRSSTRDFSVAGSSSRGVKAGFGSEDTINGVKKISRSRENGIPYEEQRLCSRGAVGLRSTRNRRGSCYVRETSPPDKRKSNNLARNLWLMLSMYEEGTRYIPQRGDEVAYLRQGHQEYIDGGTRSKDVGPWKIIKGNIKAVEFCRVVDLEYAAHSGSGESCCKMALQFIDDTSEVAGESFKLTLTELANFPDFLVLKSRYDVAMERNWTIRDKCDVWWRSEDSMEDGNWWEGRIISVMPKSAEFPDSPWERYVVQYKSDPKEKHRHSPWELYEIGMHDLEVPHIGDEIRDKLLNALAKLEESGNQAQDYYGVRSLKEASQKPSFINRFPVPLSLEVIHSRLENNYYRSLEAVEHDIEVLISNAGLHFVKSAMLSTKMRKLSDWFKRTLQSL